MALRFGKRRAEEPEINLIPFIDVLLVVLIFLMLSTTYSKFTELQITLPTADADTPRNRPQEIVVSVAADGRFAVDHRAVDGRNVPALADALRAAAGAGAASGGTGGTAEHSADAVLVISADAGATHQSVVNVMEAARRAGLPRIVFAAQGSGGAPAAP